MRPLTRSNMRCIFTKCWVHQYNVWQRLAVAITHRLNDMQAGPVADLLGLAGVKVGGSADGRGVTLDGVAPQTEFTAAVSNAAAFRSSGISCVAHAPNSHSIAHDDSAASATRFIAGQPCRHARFFLDPSILACALPAGPLAGALRRAAYLYRQPTDEHRLRVCCSMHAVITPAHRP